jgi:hypothetical protein
MTEAELLAIFFLLGKSPKDWEFLEEDWDDEYLDTTNLSWDQFMELHDQGLWELNAKAIASFRQLFSSYEGFGKVKEVFGAISAESEDWNDFLEFVVDSDDFEALWAESWLTRYEMESALEDFSANNSDAEVRIKEFKECLRSWFGSTDRVDFNRALIKMLTPLEMAITEKLN